VFPGLDDVPVAVRPRVGAPPGAELASRAMPAVLLATDADWLYDEVEAAVGGDDLTVYRVRRGVDVLPALVEVDAELVILDLQIGNMGGMAACMAVRNEEGMGRIPITAVLMLLDRQADVFLAHRSDADGWLVKPLDAFRLRRATEVLLAGETWFEGAEPAEA
jgi:DNA-binding response OmpR family regulator